MLNVGFTMTRFSLRTTLKVWGSSLRSLTERAGGVMDRSLFMVWASLGSVWVRIPDRSIS